MKKEMTPASPASQSTDFGAQSPFALQGKGIIPLLETSGTYNIDRYSWAYNAWKRQQQIHWMGEEVPLGEDIKDWQGSILTDNERNLLTQIFRFFTQSDIEVSDNYFKRYIPIFQPLEIQMMMAAFTNIECFDDQTELLTATGWKSVTELTVQDRIAQYDLEKGEISFTLPQKVVNYDYKGIMHHYEGRSTDICVTPNHDMISKHPASGKVDKVKSFERLFGRNYLYPASGKSTAMHCDLTLFERLLIAIQADGCIRALCPSTKDTWRTVDFTLHKQRKIDRLSFLLKEQGIEFSQSLPDQDGRVRVTFALPESTERTFDLLTIKEFGFIDLEKVSAQKACQLIDEIILWDGCTHKTTKQRQYYTSNKKCADVFQALSTLSGETMATLSINRKRGDSVLLPNGKEYTLDKNHWVVTLTEKRIFRTYPHRKEIPYDGKVYCVSVETQNLVSRRNGKTAFTGNTIHIDAYALLLKTLGMPNTEFAAFKQYSSMRAKADYMKTFGVGTCSDVARTLAMFGAFTEGMALFASFAMLMNFPRFNKMKGMGQIVTWSVRDESLHCESVIKLYHEWNAETGAVTPSVAGDIMDVCKTMVSLEDKFVELAFELGAVQGMTPQDIQSYVRYIADWRLTQLKLTPLYGYFEGSAGDYVQKKPHPLPWLTLMLNGVEHANFFEARATEYSKGATKGSWDGPEGVWNIFDEKKK
jgi:ribonucleotide reductase beta subunit family protein with ferritin-like domain